MARAADRPLFVYGTLRPGLAPAAIAAVARTLLPLGPARVRGRLYDLGRFPAAVADASADGWIQGELVVLGPDSPPLAWFDAYEGFDPTAPETGPFRRESGSALDASGGEVPCWIYTYVRRLDERRRLPGGAWPARRSHPEEEA